MQNNHLTQYDVDLLHADNRLIQQLREARWAMNIKSDNKLESQEAFALDMRRSQFLVKDEKYMDILENFLKTSRDSEEKNTIHLTHLSSHLSTIYPDVGVLRIEEDVHTLNNSWNQDIGGMVLKAINDALQADPETAHLYFKCDYTTNLTYENGKMVLNVDYFNLQIFNSHSFEAIPLPSKSMAARWELSEGYLRLRKVEGNDKDLIRLTQYSSVPQDFDLFNNPSYFTKDQAKEYLKAKQEQIEKLWHVNSAIKDLNHLPGGVRRIYEKCLAVDKSNANVIKLATEVKKIWTDKWQKRENQKHSFLGKVAKQLNKDRDTRSDEFYKETPTPKKNS